MNYFNFSKTHSLVSFKLFCSFNQIGMEYYHNAVSEVEILLLSFDGDRDFKKITAALEILQKLRKNLRQQITEYDMLNYQLANQSTYASTPFHGTSIYSKYYCTATKCIISTS